MSEHKHTPGPWVIDNRSVSDAEPQANSGRRALGDVIAECPTAFSGNTIRAPHTAHESCPTKEVLDERGIANARLVCAAPDLLAEMKRHLPILERMADMPEFWESITSGTGVATLNGYRAAIANAEGKP